MKAVKIVLGLWIVVLALILIVSGCEKTDVSENFDEYETGSAETGMGQASGSAGQQVVTEQVIEEAPELPVCGDAVCDETELGICWEDCPSCDDNDKCTVDYFDLESLKCVNRNIKNCCGDGFCGEGESCAEDCPPKMLSLASYPFPFVHGDDLEADIIVGDEGTSKDVSAATEIATGLGINAVVYGKLASEISTIKNKNVILVGNPCTNVFIAQLMPYNSGCLEDYDEGEGRLSLFATGMDGSDYTYALVVSGYSGDDIRRAAGILGDYERKMAVLKGLSVKV